MQHLHPQSKPMFLCKKRQSSPITSLELPRGFQEVKVPDFMKTAQDGGKIVILAHRPPLSPGNAPGTHFC